MIDSPDIVSIPTQAPPALSQNGHNPAIEGDSAARAYITALIRGETVERPVVAEKWHRWFECFEMNQGQGTDALERIYASLKQALPEFAALMAGQGTGATDPGRWIKFRPETYYENRPPREWLIPGLLPKSGIAMVFGPPSSGKSLLVMAWSLCIVRGLPWLDRQVVQGSVAYIASEGAFGIGARTRAWKYSTQGLPGEAGLLMFDQPITLQDQKHLKQLLTALEEDFPSPPVLVVIDTLSRCSAGADENSNTEMAKVVASADMIQQKFGCTVLFVHHVGKDAQKGPRGASALIGNMETIIEVTPTEEGTDGGCRVTCYKQKDAPRFAPISLKLERVQFGENADESSAILVQGSDDAGYPLTPSESLMLTLLQQKPNGMTHTDWTEAGRAASLSESAAKKAIGVLANAGKVQHRGRLYYVPQMEYLDE